MLLIASIYLSLSNISFSHPFLADNKLNLRVLFPIHLLLLGTNSWPTVSHKKTLHWAKSQLSKRWCTSWGYDLQEYPFQLKLLPVRRQRKARIETENPQIETDSNLWMLSHFNMSSAAGPCQSPLFIPITLFYSNYWLALMQRVCFKNSCVVFWDQNYLQP